MDPEMKDSLPPLPRERVSMRSGSRKGRLIAAPSDDNDSAVSMVSLSQLSNTELYMCCTQCMFYIVHVYMYVC